MTSKERILLLQPTRPQEQAAVDFAIGIIDRSKLKNVEEMGDAIDESIDLYAKTTKTKFNKNVTFELITNALRAN